jgi:hypothetical protein
MRLKTSLLEPELYRPTPDFESLNTNLQPSSDAKDEEGDEDI